MPALLCFFILHLLVYPSSNGYNSYIDRDQSPIGGLAKPLLPTKQLYYTTVVMDIVAIALSLFISISFAVGILIYIAASRAYSSRGIRLKRYAIPGFLVVFVCQGALVFYLSFIAAATDSPVPLLPLLISSCLIGALYPLTQVYQHEADRQDNVTTLSIMVGKRGTFIFSISLFLVAAAGLWMHLTDRGQLNHFYLFLLITLPVLVYFFYWMSGVWKDEQKADFKRSLTMNFIATLCTGIYFITLIVLNQ
jgi:1,4-dihydroxy-2-naphthoate polyprenyltransferase